MKKIIGIDFGTANVRIAQWDSEEGTNPSICLVGGGNTTTMPAVIAFTRQAGGDVVTVVGEDADVLNDERNIQVIRNVKRWALGSDSYVRSNIEWHLEQRNESWPTWWEPCSRAIRLWNKTIPVKDAIRLILKEAISRAGLLGVEAEWRAGCPVSSDLTYRETLVSALADLGCEGKIKWITEEPSLFCKFGASIGSLENGSYLIYDMGGGSFDCSVVEIERDDNGKRNITVLGQDSIPTLGGMNIDDALKERFSDEPLQTLRVSKEQLTSTGSVSLSGNHNLKMDDVEAILEKEMFISRTLDSMVRAYRNAKLWWKRDPHAPPMGEYLKEAGDGMQRKVLSDMAIDIDEVLLVGGPTQLPYFRRELGRRFGDEKIITTTRDLLGRRTVDADIPDVALTALSYGACHMQDEQYIPKTVERIPAKITLKVTDGASEDQYEAFSGMACCAGCTRPWTERPHHMAPHKGEWVTIPPLSERSRDKFYSYTVSIEDPDGDLLERASNEMRLPGEYTRPRADRIRLVLDRLGRVWVELEAGTKIHSRENVPITETPPWQTEAQRAMIKKQYEEQRRYEEKEAARLHRNLTNNPFGWQSDVG